MRILDNIFTYRSWDKICDILSKNYDCILARDILDYDNNNGWMVVKHDVETDVEKSLIIARIEASYGIRSTYYVQSSLLKDNLDLLRQIKDLGHDVTYHYDVLDANNGDFDLAISEFRKTVILFNKNGFNVDTVCPHGNPILDRKGWSSNKDFFRNDVVSSNFPEILDIVVHLPERLGVRYCYVSDASYKFKKIANIHDNDIRNLGDDIIPDIHNFLIKNKKNDSMIISTHPHRWESNAIKFLFRRSLFIILRFVARQLNHFIFFRRIMSRYYYFSKKI